MHIIIKLYAELSAVSDGCMTRAGSLISTLVSEYKLPTFAFIGLLCGIILYIAGNSHAADLVWYAVLVLGGIPLIIETLKKVAGGVFSADVVATLAIIVAFLLGNAFPGAIIVMMQSSGEALERYGFKRASSSLEQLIARAPKTARRKKGKDIEEISAEAVVVGDILVIRHGDMVPVDGVVTRGMAYLDESALTGEPVPKKKKAGDNVLSGSINSSGTFEMKTLKKSSQSEYAKIVELVRKAQQEKPGIQRLADRYAVYFTPLTLIMAGAGFLLTGRFETVLAVLVVATPCPLIIAVPIAVIAGVNRAANSGIIVKSGAAIEQIGNADTVFLDKTGTITYGEPLVERIIPVGRHNSKDLLYKSACVEQLSAHPLAVALVKKARKSFGKLEAPRKFKEHPSSGVEGWVGKSHVAVGSRKFYEKITGMEFIGDYQKMVDEENEKGSLCSLIAIDGDLAGIIVLKDKLRPGIKNMLSELGDMGVQDIHMLTGDNDANARVIAEEAGLKNYETGLLPEDKERIVRQATESGKDTVMVGDGINDAPALATATVGVAMGARGTGISAEAADVVILVDDATKIGEAMKIGRRMLRIAKESILFGIGASLVLMVIAGFGYIPPAIGAVLQEVIDVTVILNALRVR